MLVIYDLDRTSLYCPIADFMDRFIPKNRVLKRIYYSLYPFVHILEMKLGLLKINEAIYRRALQFKEIKGCIQVVITARHHSFSLKLHVKQVFKDIDITTFAIAQGLTDLHKVDVLPLIPRLEDEEILMFDDNLPELRRCNHKYKGKFTGVQIEFKGEEKILSYVN